MRAALKKRLHRVWNRQASTNAVIVLASVKSKSRDLRHDISLDKNRVTCDCEWYRYHRDEPCRHIRKWLTALAPLPKLL